MEENIINFKLSLEEGAVIVPGFGNYFLALIEQVGKKYKVRTNVPYKDLTPEERHRILYGTGETIYKVNFQNEEGYANTYNSKFEGVINTLNRRFFEAQSFDDNKILDYVTEVDCPLCEGKRLKKESLTVFIKNKDIGDITSLNVGDALKFIDGLGLT